MNGRVIEHPDDLVRGSYVTVVRWNNVEKPVAKWGPYGDFNGMSKPATKRTMFGEALRVVAVSLPFVLVRNLDGGLTNIDLRRAVLAPLDRRFALALLAEHRTKKKAGVSTARPSGGSQNTVNRSLAYLYASMLGGGPTAPEADDDDDDDDE